MLIYLTQMRGKYPHNFEYFEYTASVALPLFLLLLDLYVSWLIQLSTNIYTNGK